MSGAGDMLRLVLPMMRGAAVRAVQEALARRGRLPARGIDGLFGPQTRDAVAAFQAATGLPATGVVDTDTRRALLGGADVGAGAAAGAAAAPRRRSVAPVVPAAHLPEARPERVILHWTGGGANASALDRQHYHFLIQQDGQVMKGAFTIADNDSTADGRYAAHTKNKNTRSVGVALCGMAGGRERPFRPGPAPIVAPQLEVMARLVAQICQRYAIPVTRRTVLAHGEVQEILGTIQDGKWDPLVLPWRLDMSKREVGDHLRALVSTALEGAPAEDDAEERVLDVELLGTTVTGGATASDGRITVPLGKLLDLLGWRLTQVQQEGVTLMTGDRPILVALERSDHEPDEAEVRACSISIEDLAEQLDLEVGVRADGLAVSVGGGSGAAAAPEAGDGFRRVTVARGDTLSAIARRELGDAAAWQRILMPDGAAFDEASARRLLAGQQVLVPAAAAPAVEAPPAEEADLLERIAEAIAADTFAINRPAVREHVPRMIRACRRHGVTDPAHVAYVLATAEHETNFGRTMIEDWGPTKLQSRYERNPSNEKPGDGKRYLGRGFVQLTFRENYRKFARVLEEPLEDEPDRAADPELAAEILALGMSRVGYRSPKFVLGRYGFDTDFDFEGARAIVNADVDRFAKRYGTTVGVGVGRQARKYFRSLRELL